jgi:hypothetical protein
MRVVALRSPGQIALTDDGPRALENIGEVCLDLVALEACGAPT